MENLINHNSENNNAVLQMMNDTSLCPALMETEVKITNYTKLPIERLSSIGIAFQPLATAVQKAVTGSGGSGLYYVNTKGKTMFQMKGTSNYIGSLKDFKGLVGGGQAQMTPLSCDPTMLFMAAALANIEKKLDNITEMQQEMLDFLIHKEKSELKGNLTFLYDIYNNYKYNWNNNTYKSNNHIKVLDIKQAVEAKIVFYREQIIAKTNKKSVIHSKQTVNKQLQNIQEQFKDYQLALYILAFSSFLEVILLENYNANYLSCLSSKIDSYSINYRELYSKCYEEIELYSSSSIQSAFLKKISRTSTNVGKFVEKIPIISNTQIDENLISTGDKINAFRNEKIKSQMQCLIERQSNFVRPFIDNINTINKLYNKPIQLLVDKSNIYLATIA